MATALKRVKKKNPITQQKEDNKTHKISQRISISSQLVQEIKSMALSTHEVRVKFYIWNLTDTQ